MIVVQYDPFPLCPTKKAYDKISRHISLIAPFSMPNMLNLTGASLPLVRTKQANMLKGLEKCVGKSDLSKGGLLLDKRCVITHLTSIFLTGM